MIARLSTLGMVLLLAPAAGAATIATSFLVRGADRLDCVVTNTGDKPITHVTRIVDALGTTVAGGLEATLDAGRTIVAAATPTHSGYCRVDFKGKQTAV